MNVNDSAVLWTMTFASSTSAAPRSLTYRLNTIVDILVGVPASTQLQTVADQIENLGYESLGEAGVPGRQHLRCRDPRSFNVSIVHLDSDLWRHNLALRDYLRRHPSARNRYAEAKLEAVQSGATMLLAYR